LQLDEGPQNIYQAQQKNNDAESQHSKQPSVSIDLQRLKLLKALHVKKTEKKNGRQSNISFDMQSQNSSGSSRHVTGGAVSPNEYHQPMMRTFYDGSVDRVRRNQSAMAFDDGLQAQGPYSIDENDVNVRRAKKLAHEMSSFEVKTGVSPLTGFGSIPRISMKE
jgi:hypothetical protein